MNAKMKFGLVHRIGTLLGAAGFVVFMAISGPGDTAPVEQRLPVAKVTVGDLIRLQPPSSPLLADGMLGRTVLEFIGVGIAFGLLAFGLSRVAAPRAENRRAAEREMPLAGAAVKPLVLLAIPRVFDATASEFDDDKRPSFVPVTSLTEAQVWLRRDRLEARQRRAVPASA